MVINPKTDISSLNGFTLIETLVVTAIISILIDLFLPVLNSIRKESKRIECLNNQRQLGLVFYEYAHDNRGLLPHEDDGWRDPPFGCGWYRVIDKYIDNQERTKKCPLDIRWKSYKMNSQLDNRGRPAFYKLGSSVNEESLILLFDGKTDNKGIRNQSKGTWKAVSNRHMRGAEIRGSDFLFMDGHSKWYEAWLSEYDWIREGELEWEPEQR